MIKIPNNLKSERLSVRMWELIEPFTVVIGNEKITVPAGFVTDGASVPRPLWSICAPMGGSFGEAAIIHDFLYSKYSTCTNRKIADRIFYKIGRHRGANLIQAKLVYIAVRIFGSSHWKRS